MLQSLFVKDLALVDQAEVQLHEGLTVLTGETGAGKSLLIDALILICGGRADSALVRAGSDRAEVAAEFDLANRADVRAVLKELDLDNGNSCQLRRIQRVDGGTRSYINDRPVTLQTLKDIAERLVEIHGQHEHQALLSRPRQLDMLDSFGKYPQLIDAVAKAAKTWHANRRALDALLGDKTDHAARLDFLRFQLDELNQYELTHPAIAQLVEQHSVLSHAGDLINGCDEVLAALDGDAGTPVRAALTRASAEISRLAQFDHDLSNIDELLQAALLQTDEALRSLERYRSSKDLDPEQLAAVEDKMTRLHDLARKHRVSIETLPDKAQELSEEFTTLTGASSSIQKLETELAAAQKTYTDAAQALSKARQTAAKKLSKLVTGLIAELGMGGGSFSVAFESEGDSTPSPAGIDRVEFMVTANPGQPERALRKVASGGELARISLAIEVAAMGHDITGTMVFDEVDSGIGGAVAEVVGQKLRGLSKQCQVLCVTHLAQVAVHGSEHLQVSKHVQNGKTVTAIQKLDANTRRNEIARMIGGIKITEQTLAHAGDLLERAQL